MSWHMRFPSVFCSVIMRCSFSFRWSFSGLGIGLRKLSVQYSAFVKAFLVDSVQLSPDFFCWFLTFKYRILSGPGAVSFPLLLGTSLNSSSVVSLSRPFCENVLLRLISKMLPFLRVALVVLLYGSPM